MTAAFQCRNCACVDVDEYGRPPREYLIVPDWAVNTRFARYRL